nr:splicing regulatory glutamine/lysine-rich protein 1-like [Coffea arabica]
MNERAGGSGEEKKSKEKGQPQETNGQEKGTNRTGEKRNIEDKQEEKRDMVQEGKLKEKENGGEKGKEKERQLTFKQNMNQQENEGEKEIENIHAMWIDVSEREGGEGMEIWPRCEKGEGSSAGGREKETGQEGDQKENVKIGRKSRYSRGGISGRRVPLTEIRIQNEQPRLKEKRTSMLRDEPDEMLVDSDTMEQGRTKLQKKEVQMETLLRVTEAIPEGPPQCK